MSKIGIGSISVLSSLGSISSYSIHRIDSLDVSMTPQKHIHRHIIQECSNGLTAYMQLLALQTSASKWGLPYSRFHSPSYRTKALADECIDTHCFGCG